MEKTGLLFAAPAMVLCFLLFVYPIFYNFYLSFYELKLISSPEPIFVGFKNYINVLKDPVFFNALYNTTFFTIFSVLFEFAGGLIFALLLSKIRKIWMEMLAAVCMVPMFLSDVVAGVACKFLFSPEIGLVNWTTNYFFGITIPWLTDKRFAMWTIIFIDSWKMMPFFIIIFLAAMISIPKDLTEALTLDGASEIQRIRYLVIPYMFPVFVVSVVMRTIDAFTKIFGIVYVVTYGGPGTATDVIPLRIYTLVFQAFNWGVAATWGVYAFMISIVLILIYVYVIRKWRM